MKILFISNQLGGGGAERVLTLIANHLVDENEVFIISFSPGVSKYKIDSRINTKEIQLSRKTALKTAMAIRKEVLRIKPDCFISFEYHMNMKALLGTIGINDIRKIISERNDPSQKGGKQGQKQLRELLYQLADALVCQTKDAKEYFPKSIQKKTVIIPNPISDNLPDPWTGTREKRIVNFCRLEKQKNIPMLIDAFEKFVDNHKDYHLEIYGDGSEKDNIEEYIKRKKLNDVVKMFPATQNIHEIILRSMMYASSSDYEGISNSMLEALALGLPTICTDCPCGGARMFIDDGLNGFLVGVGDSSAMADRMAFLAEHENIRIDFSKRSVEIREEISSHKIVKMWLDILT